MKNESIHDGFDKSEIRNFLSKKLRMDKSCAYRDWGTGQLENESTELLIEEKKLREKIEYNKEMVVIKKLISSMGWGIFDVSDYVEYTKESYFSFLGTEKEVRELIKNYK